MDWVRPWLGAVSRETRSVTGSARAVRMKGAARVEPRMIRRPIATVVTPLRRSDRER